MKVGSASFFKINKNILLLFFFVILGLVIRAYKLGSSNLWFDEYFSLEISRIFKFSLLRNDYNPPLYYTSLSIWIKYFGSSEFALRSLSMIFGILSISLIYRLGKLFFDTTTGLLSAFILSILPIHIWYSQEARGYSLSIFLAMLTVYLFILAIKKNRTYLWIGFIISSILALYANYFSFFIIFFVGILFFSKRYKPLLKHYLISLCLILIVFLPLLPIFFQQISYLENGFRWIPKLNFRSIAITFANFNVGYNATHFIVLFTFIIFSLLFILGIQRWWQEKRKELLFLISFILIPIFIIYLISQRISIYLDRQLLLFSPFYYIIISAGLGKINMRIIKVAAYLSIIVPILICLNNYFSYRMPLPLYHHIGVYVKKPVKPTADYINSRYEKGDLVAFSDMSIWNIFYYMPDIPIEQRAYFFIESEMKYDEFSHKKLEKSAKFRLQRKMSSNIYNLSEEKSNISGAKSFKELDFKRIWLISSSWDRDGGFNSHVRAVRQFMQDRYLLLESKESDGILVDLYSIN